MEPSDQNPNGLNPQGGSSVHSSAQEEIRVEDLPLDKKLDFLRKCNTYDFYQEGKYIDSQDTVNSWCLAKVNQIEGKMLSVHFDGWSNRWDVWQKINSYKIAPFRKLSRCYTGQNKVALRTELRFSLEELHQEKQRVEKLIDSELSGLSAFDTTQYFRGQLYIYVDFLLGANTYNEEQVDAINDFLHSVLRLIVTWMRKVIKLLPLFAQLKVNSDLFLIDSNIAIIMCWPEFVDILRKIFGCCHRCARYYLLFDKNQIKYDQLITIDETEKDFEALRKKDDEEIDIGEVQATIKQKQLPPFGQLLNFLNYFAMIGGFDAILDVLKFGNESEEKIPFELYDALTSPFRNCQDFFSKSFSLSFVNNVKDLIFYRINNISEKELKELDKEAISRLLIDIKDFLMLSMTDKDTAQLIETTQLIISLRFLKSNYLEKRLKGITDIKLMIDRVEANANQKMRGNSRLEDKNQIYYQNKIKPSKFLQVEDMAKWLLDQKILDIVFGENTHLEIVKRGGCIVKFLGKQGALPQEAINLIWKCQAGKHEEMVRVVFNLIKDQVPFLSISQIDEFYALIQTVPPSQYDEKFLQFLKEFTLKGTESYWDQKSREVEMSEEQATDYDEICLQNENQVLENIRENLKNINEKQILGDSKLYGCPKFWDLIQDKVASSVPVELMELSLNSLSEILKQPSAKNVRIYYFLKCIENLQKKESVVPSIIIASQIISEFNEIGYSQNHLSQSKLIALVNSQIQLIDQLINNIEHYNNQVKEKAKNLSEKQRLTDDVSKIVFIGRQTHENSLNKFLDFLEFLILSAQSEHVSLGTKNIDTLWRIFVQQPNFNYDQNTFLKWINKYRELSYQKEEQFLFTEDEKKHFFINILCNPTYVNFQKISLAQVKCFHKYFKVINKQEGNINYNRKKTLVIKFQSLIGLDTLFRITIESESDKVREESIELLVDMHLKFDHASDPTHLIHIWENFIKTCYQHLDSQDLNIVTNAICLLSTFLDRYEGKKNLKPEFRYPSQFNNYQNNTLSVINKMTNTKHPLSVSYFQTLGYVRAKIAEMFGLHINQFDMHIKNQYVDPDENDDRYLKDLYQFSTVTISKNPQYNPDLHPKNIICQNEQFFEKLFQILSQDKPALIEHTWELLNKLPVNEKLQNEIRELNIKEGDKINWSKILDPKSTYRLLYSLLIIKNTYIDQNNQAIQPGISMAWKKHFADLGGFNQLLAAFIHLDVTKIESQLTLKCLDCLCYIIQEFLPLDPKFAQELIPHKENIFLKCFHWIELITNYSLEVEKNRGQSLEDIQTKIHSNKMKRNKYKSYQQGNKQDKQANDDDEGDDSQESNTLTQILKHNREVCGVVKSLFNFIQNLGKIDPSIVILIAQYPNIDKFLAKSMILCEIPEIRMEVSKKIKDMILTKSQQPEMAKMQNVLSILLFDLNNVHPKSEFRTFSYYDSVNSLINMLHIKDILPLEKNIQKLIQDLINEIQKREQKEKNAQETDYILHGKMNMLKVLIMKFSNLKEDIGKQILYFLLHECLFQIPQGSTVKSQVQGTQPKCKSYYTRQAAIQLLAVLVRDCLPNLKMVLTYIHKFNQNSSWRTNKEHDWNISLMESEKSQTGYVGIKNLGCICYMNSLFQQLFMIPSMRRDILSVKRPALTQEEKDEDMLYQLQMLFAGLLKSEKQYVSPKSFCNAFKDWEGQPTNVLEQMDVEEFYNMFMDRLEGSIKGSQQENSIQYHFGGKFASEMICKGCPHFYERQEPFISLSLTVKNKKSIIEGLNTFIMGDMLEGENAYLCEKCDKKVDTLKRTCIKKLPRYMMIALKRFEFDFDRMIRVKVNDYCEFPMELDMTDFTQEGLRRKEKEKAFREEKGDEAEYISEPLKYPKEYYEYKLSGVVVHTGTADSGHYYSFISDREHPESGKWYEFNDHIVRDFDPNDIPSECFGGEDTFQGYNMVSMKSMKWRNAYLVLYERKNPIEVNSDDEEEKEKTASKQESVQTDTEMSANSTPNQIQILPEIEEKIAYENQKYWQNRFLFSPEYLDLVLDVSVNWNTMNIVPANSLTKNNDFHIYNVPPPPEYFRDILSFGEPNDEKIDLLKRHSQEEVELAELDVFKFASQFYITILQRAQNKTYIPQMLNIQKAYLNKNIKCCEWLLREFSNFSIIEENLLQCSQKEMRKFIVGLLYCAMLKIYEVERDRLNDYWKTEEHKPTTVLANFILVIIRHLFDSMRFQKNVAQYLQLLARFSTLGKEAREFLLRGQMVGRLLEIHYDKVSPFKDQLRNLDDLQPNEEEKPDIGLPTQIDKKNMSAYQEIIENRRRKNLAEGPLKYKYLFETLGNIMRSVQVGPQPSPYQMDDVNFAALTQADQTFLSPPDIKYMKGLLENAKRNRGLVAICKGYLHYSYYDDEMYTKLRNTIMQGLFESDYDQVKPFLVLLQFMLQKPQNNYEQKIDILLQMFMDQVKQNANFYRFMETMFEFIFKITSRIPEVRQWFYVKKNQWEWLWDWVNANKIAPNPIAQNSSVKYYKRRATVTQLQTHQTLYKMDQQRSQAMTQYRLKRLQQLSEQNVPDLSQEIDLDIIDMQDHKFTRGELVDTYIRKLDKSHSYAIEIVLDEMINVKNLSMVNENYQNNIWYGCDTDKLIPGRSHKHSYRQKLLETIYQSMEQRREQQMQPRSGQQLIGDRDPQDDDPDQQMSDDEEAEEDEESSGQNFNHRRQ